MKRYEKPTLLKRDQLSAVTANSSISPFIKDVPEAPPG